MKKRLVLVLIVALIAGMAFAQAGAESSGKIKIGALIRNQNEQFVVNYTDNLKKLAAEAGVEINVQDGQGDVAKQLDQLNTLIAQGYKYFVIIPQDSSATEQMTKAIQAVGGAAAFSNIQPTVEALKVGKNFYHASSPEAVAGQYQAEIIDEYFTKNNKGKVLNMLYLNGQLGHPAQVNRRAGLMDALKAKGYTVNVIAEDTADWAPDKAQEKMDAWSVAYRGKFNIVVTQNDDMALGAISSLKANGYTKSDANDGTYLTVPVLGVDATPTGLASMDKKEMYATVLQDAIGQSSTAFNLVLTCAKEGTAYGKTVNGLAPAKEVIAEAPANDAAVIGQCYLVPFKPVTQDNYKDLM